MYYLQSIKNRRNIEALYRRKELQPRFREPVCD
jgi:hypothetical protein